MLLEQFLLLVGIASVSRKVCHKSDILENIMSVFEYTTQEKFTLYDVKTVTIRWC